MNAKILRLGVAFMVLYTLLFAQLNNVQLFGAEKLAENPVNNRRAIRDFGQARGAIWTADGVLIARSDPVANGQFENRRVYPEGELFAEVTGYVSFNSGSAGVEREYNDELAGRTAGQAYGDVGDFFLGRDTTADITMTLRADVQRVARDALGDRRGAVVALDPRSGAIIAMWGWPTYDPNLLADTDTAAANVERRRLLDAAGNPLLPTTYRELYFPGSTFKVVTATAAVDNEVATLRDPVFADERAYTPPLTDVPVGNFGGSTCGGDLAEIMRRSCNSAFAQLAAEIIGPGPLIATAEAFGFNQTPPIDLPDAVASVFPADYGEPLQSVDSFFGRPAGGSDVQVYEDTPSLARAAIGQFDVKASPLQMALVAGAVGNAGVMREPHVVAEVRQQNGDLVGAGPSGLWQQSMTLGTSVLMREAMVGVVVNGTAGRLAVDGFEVGGKTGTAQLGRSVAETHAWIIGFAGEPGQPAQVAVAVLVEADPAVGQQTGGTVAAPIAQQVLAQALLPVPAAPEPADG